MAKNSNRIESALLDDDDAFDQTMQMSDTVNYLSRLAWTPAAELVFMGQLGTVANGFLRQMGKTGGWLDHRFLQTRSSGR
ncbi:hypothetical protein OsJ_24724 [Oryza sativa Japonica Group]|uniref:Uncharacterized protein n=1 Tax=Oryza sativa subsp. japonica TaxID=39947 RepID=A3BL43_ORYSJ|nr:hypothetical protein OsJ_24724 [Oryza sativa Japonica Group]